jgi:Domain of unknown function (DUF4386)
MNQDTRALRRASLIAGLALALMAALAAFGNFVAIQPLVTPGDAVKTAIDISNSEALFRWGIASLILVAVLDIIVAAALLRLFEPVNRSVSITAAWFRVAYVAVYLVAVIQLVVAVGLLGEPDQALRAIDAYGTIWLVGLILFGVHLLLIGYLAYRSGFVAKVFGILLVIAGLGYIADGFVAVLVQGPSISIGQFTFVGEVALIFWLLIKGARKDFSDAEADQAHHLESDSLVGRSPIEALDRRTEVLTTSGKEPT